VESEHRVYAMSLIHQKLYKSSNVSTINMPEYIGDLVEYLRYSFAVSGKLWFDIQVEPINLDLQQAVPVGLILNEVITNSFKYAFPYSDEDKITVRLFASGDGWLSLIIADNGRGLPPNFDPKQRNSFGMLLIGGLTEDLEGTLHIESIHGTSVHIRFRQIHAVPVSEDGSRESAHF
jgi:two-component sensor histidine kinase